MKKIITTIALAVIITANAQDGLTSKKGEPILPEAGDWAIGIDATPFLNYAGNFFGKQNVNTSPTWGFQSVNASILGKYFNESNKAFRAGIRIGLTSNTQRKMVDDRSKAPATLTVFPNQDPMVENTWKSARRNFGLTGGMEFRKGKTRLQGFYGGEVGFFISSGKDKFTYGNSLAPTANPAVLVHSTDDNFAGSGNISSNPPIQNVVGAARALEIKQGTTFTFGIRGFIGAEYFILPKLALGGEFGWAILLSSTSKTKTVWESVGLDANNQQVTGTTTIESSKQGSFGFDTDNKNNLFGPVAALRLILHF
ncbi:MAG: hypothetical protein N3F09_10620 [Bacteroidia bacterium]|nr:hypothetical protein [Bacteroidia bacterium]